MADPKNFTEIAEDIKEDISKSIESGAYKIQSITKIDGTSKTYISPSEQFDLLERAKNLSTEESSRIKSAYRPIHLRRTSFKR